MVRFLVGDFIFLVPGSFGASLLGCSSESSCRIHVVLAVPFISQLEVTLLVLGYV